jgi:hypothetical protein
MNEEKNLVAEVMFERYKPRRNDSLEFPTRSYGVMLFVEDQ